MENSILNHNYPVYLAKGLCHIGDDNFIFTDFSNIFILNVKSLQIKKIEIDYNGFETRWNPTGLYFWNEKNLLFLANYLRKNIIVFTLCFDKSLRAKIINILDDKMLGPESVFINEHLEQLVVCDEEASLVSCYAIHWSNHETIECFEKRWQTDVKAPHGLLWKGDDVIVTSMNERRIKILDFETGEIRQTIGDTGMAPHKLEFLWPSYVSDFDADHILMIDNSLGFVRQVSLPNFEVVRSTGGYGPGPSFLANPMQPVIRDESIFLATPYQERFVEISLPDLTIIRSFWYGSSPVAENELTEKTVSIPWGWLESLRGQEEFDEVAEDLNSFEKSWSLRGEYLENLSCEPVRICGIEYIPGNTRLWNSKRTGNKEEGIEFPNLTLETYHSIFNNTSNIFDLVHYLGDADSGLLIFSLQRANPIALFQFQGFLQILPVPLANRYDKWPIAGKLVNAWGIATADNGTPVDIYFDALREKAAELAQLTQTERIKELMRFLCSQNPSLRPDVRWQDFFAASITSDAGKAFMCLAVDSETESAVRKAAFAYFERIAKINSVELEEFSLISMISGVAPGHV